VIEGNGTLTAVNPVAIAQNNFPLYAIYKDSNKFPTITTNNNLFYFFIKKTSIQ
jgi:hypothetical protein